MPTIRCVRPSFVALSVDNRTVKATGPKNRSEGELSAQFFARSRGEAVELVSVDAITSPDGSSVLWRITDNRTGAVLLEERIPQ